MTNALAIFQPSLCLYIDQIQRLPGPGLFLKTLCDLDLNLKVLASGSSSLEIRSASKERMVGRGREPILYPLSFGDIAASRIPGLQQGLAHSGIPLSPCHSLGRGNPAWVRPMDPRFREGDEKGLLVSVIPSEEGIQSLLSVFRSCQSQELNLPLGT
jgi:hypothetical protein